MAYDQSTAFRNNARTTLDIASGSARPPAHIPAPPRHDRKGRRVSVIELNLLDK